MKKLIIYCRVSTELQRDNTSLQMQEERCLAWCKAFNFEVANVSGAGSCPDHCR